jgi:glucosamine 6-phosphate synthetase-like amidotransferase/phosphosugar isomerase protein
MCGINCISSKLNSEFPIFRSIEDVNHMCHTSHRGSDSYGFAWISDDLDQIQHFKEVGAISRKRAIEVFKGQTARAVLGHTRRASQGAITAKNAHPFLNEDRTIALIHNGHVYVSHLRDQIKNHTLDGETDSEVILHYFEEQWNKSMDPDSIMAALLKTTSDFTGAKNLLLLFKDKTIAVYSDGTLNMRKTPNNVIIDSVPTTSGKDWSYLPRGTALILKDGEVIRRNTSVAEPKEPKKEKTLFDYIFNIEHEIKSTHKVHHKKTEEKKFSVKTSLGAPYNPWYHGMSSSDYIKSLKNDKKSTGVV